MINVKDIRIGDYFRVNRDGLCIKKGTVVGVRGIDADDKLIEKGLIGSTHCRPLDEEQFDGGIWCDFLDPIPLTAEILEKNGWMKVEVDGVFYPKQLKGELPWIGYATNEDSWIFRVRDFCEIKYVHELQHALRLCGIEHEITL